MTAQRVPEPLLDRLRRGHRFLLVSHMNPDGDAIGSGLGLARLLRQMGKGATVWNRDPVPKIYTALPGAERIHVGTEAPKGFPELYDALIALECPSPERTGLEEFFSERPVLNLDHHLGNEQYGEVNWVDTSAPAVGEMVFRIAGALKLELDVDTANALYLTLVTDTGGFRFSNTTPETFDAAAELVRSGARPEVVSRWLYESQPVSAVRLLGEMLGSLELHRGGHLASVWITREMAERAGAQPGDSEGLIDHPRSIAGVEAVALFRELEDERFKVSLRSRGEVDVEKVARHFGGGGHHNAAGFSRDGVETDTLVAETLEHLGRAIDTEPPEDEA